MIPVSRTGPSTGVCGTAGVVCLPARGVQQAAETDVFRETAQVALAARTTRLLPPAPQTERTCEVVFRWFLIYKGFFECRGPACSCSGSSEPCRGEPRAGCRRRAQVAACASPPPAPRPCPESRSWFLGSLTWRDREDVAEAPAPARRPSRAVRSAQPPVLHTRAAGVLCGLAAGPTAPVAAGTAPGECRDVGVASRLGVPGDEATPGCEPPAVHRLCWPASGAAKFCCSKTPNCSQTRAGPAPRAAGWWVLPSPPMQEGFFLSPPPHAHRLPPGSGAAGEPALALCAPLPSVPSSPGRMGSPGCPGCFSFRLYRCLPERFTCRSLF